MRSVPTTGKTNPEGLPSRAISPLIQSAYAPCKSAAGLADTAYEEANVSVVKPVKASSLVPVLEPVDRESHVRQSGCRDTCSFDAGAEWHHARLRTLENDQDALLEFLELAITWHELEYSRAALIPPDQWMAFVESHRWTSPARVERIFSLATDVFMTAERATRTRPGISDCMAIGPTIPR